MKARPPEYWGSKTESPNTWIRCTKRVFDTNEWTENRTKVLRAKVALKGLAKRWATANDHLLAPKTCTWEESKRLFRTKFCPSDFEQKLRKDIFTICQYTGETVRAYAESRDVPLAKNPSTGTAQQRLFLVLKVVLHAIVVISEMLRLSTKSRCSRCCRAHL